MCSIFYKGSEKMAEKKNKAVPVLDHVQIKELEKWLPFQKHPIVIVDEQQKVEMKQSEHARIPVS
jgi:hypothetical protein